ncbi:hypothetical protein BRD17_04220 [Halobacteriales archaeon SW_7_68_16]|nr:MAG: hypothetical protein BRD17_04220 [Halobacteriales archaeon SW_7_68_16]
MADDRTRTVAIGTIALTAVSLLLIVVGAFTGMATLTTAGGIAFGLTVISFGIFVVMRDGTDDARLTAMVGVMIAGGLVLSTAEVLELDRVGTTARLVVALAFFGYIYLSPNSKRLLGFEADDEEEADADADPDDAVPADS